MIIRLILSLAFIGGVLLFAARLAKKRGLGQGNGLIEVVARHRLGRASTLNVVRIADVVLVVGATEEQVTLLAELDSDTVDDALHERTPVRQLPSAGLPDLARRVLGPQLAVVETVRWGPADADGEREGAVGVEVPGVPVTFTGGMHLRRGAGPGTTEQVLDGELQAAIPLLGRKIESASKPAIEQSIDDEIAELTTRLS